MAQVVVGMAAGSWHWGGGSMGRVSADSSSVLPWLWLMLQSQRTLGWCSVLGCSPACTDTPNLVVCAPKVFPPKWRW